MLHSLALRADWSAGSSVTRRRAGYLTALALCSTSLLSLVGATDAQAQSPSLVNVCAGLGVTLPHLTPLPTVTSSFSLVTGLTSTLNGLVDGVNQGVVAPLSDVTLRVGVLDSNGNLVTVASPGGCNVSASSLTLDSSKGLAIGGGRIAGLGSLAASAPKATEISAIALGNDSITALGSTDAIALGTQASVNGASATAVGLRAQSNATDAIALGTDANANAAALAGLSLGARSTVSVPGGVALGSGSAATRAGLGGATEAFSGAVVGSANGAVSVGTAGAERQITNVAGGTMATDAVNVRQLSAVGGNLATSLGGGARFDATTGAFTPPSYTVQGSAQTTVGGAINALDLRLSATTTATSATAIDLQQLQNQVAALPNLVQQDGGTRVLSVGRTTDGTLVTIAGTGGDRRLSGLAAGTATNDAVTLGQLRSAAGTVANSLGGGAGFDVTTGVYQGPSYTVAGTAYGSVDRAIGALDGLSLQYVPGISGAATNVVDLSKGGSLGLVTLRSVAPGAVTSGSTDAVNGAQLYTTNQQVAANSFNLSVLQNAFGTSSIGLLGQDPITRTITVGAATNGSTIDVSGTAGDRRIAGVAAGVSATDAVNVGQLTNALSTASGSQAALAVSNQAQAVIPSATGTDAVALGFGATASGARSVAVGNGSVATQADTVSVGAVGAERRIVNVGNGTVAAGSTDAINGGQLATTNQQVASVSSTLAGLRGSLDAGTVGLVQQDPMTRTITVAAATDGNLVDMRGSAGNRRITGVASGSTGSDAVNVDQLNTALAGVGTLVSGIPLAADNRSGLAAPAATGRDSVAIGYGASATADRSVALGSGSVADQADTVSVGRPGAERRLVNVAAGAVVSGSTDAVNGGQLFGTATQLAGVFGGGARFDAQTGIFTGPTYTIRGSTYSDVGRAFGAVDAALAEDAGNITAVTRQVASLLASPPGTPLVQQPPGGDVNIAPQTGGTVVNVGGTEGPRTVSGVANGAAAGDAVNVGQLNAATQALSSQIQDFPVRANNTRGAARPVASGADAYASGYGASAIGDASVAIGAEARASGIATTSVGQESRAQADRSTAVGSNSVAAGTDSAAFGQQSQATASAATAIGAAAQATYEGATAIGYGAKATADPTTAVGYKALASGNEASSFGGFASATADNATALGRSANASGAGATAAGANATAQGTDSVAVGRAAQATQDNAVAIGAGTATTRANQVAVGTSRQTYTLAGLPSAESTAVQSGPTNFVTTDAAGNLAASAYGPASLDALSSRIGTIEGNVAGLQAATMRLQRDMRTAFQGTAIALSLAGAVLPEGKTYAVSANFGAFHGESAFGATGTARISDNLFASAGIGVATSGRSNVGARGGVTMAW